MIAREIITDNIPPLKTTDSGEKALAWMQEFKISHLPLLDDGEYVALISEANILDFPGELETLEPFTVTPFKPAVSVDEHIYEVMRVMTKIQCTVMPVIDHNNSFCGVITAENIMAAFSNVIGMNNPGGIIILEFDHIKDYSLSDIARITEANQTQILSLNIASIPDSTRIAVTIKINRTTFRDLISTLERYEYNVRFYYNEEEAQDFMQERYDSLMNYLNI